MKTEMNNTGFKMPAEILAQGKYYSRFKLLNSNDKIRVIEAMEEYAEQFKPKSRDHVGNYDVSKEAHYYASSMQNDNVTDDELYLLDCDIYHSVANWQNKHLPLPSCPA